MIDNRWIRSGFIAAAFLMAVTIFAGAEQAAQLRLFPPPWDKLAHFLYYGTIAFLLAPWVGRRWLWITLVLVPVIGAADEWHQSLVPGRDASIWDWVADGVGTVGFVAAYWWATRKTSEKVKGER